MCTKCYLRITYAIQDAPATSATMHKTTMTNYVDDFCLTCKTTDDPNQIASTAATTPVDVPSWQFNDAAPSTHSSFSKTNRPSETSYFGMNLNHTTVRRSSTVVKDERDFRLSKEEQPPLVLLTPSQMSALEAETPTKEAPDVFEEMRKSIAIQESLLSAMRASWHGSTDAENYMPRRMSRMERERMSEERFAKDCDRFEEL
ncbi:hypothetical protein SPRG_11402 [Saprolegnia parasitica CBS 223.65]|uniref:Uncharacterized protein n=1 Tax=Saprolegnia parasitica (strain CBS 223.65) TaxID=695850 RepID=A0A067BY56_SAPPC|nr:hypothetical protein SPRG_11402 [Saprolegnia parasitica CBS 223.65]KDO23479.1 hypothetical protein SPRG_11402 [Saprolegnia parasitica CBS 223.65]|eukprot:XP_012205794.1 hypothetical protein SPRG_11402 [Saprolegnia parasitica CBS 223.65]